MDIELLRECYMLSQSLSFSATAKKLFITQSVLSRHIASLESEIGAAVFIRTKNGLKISSAGAEFLVDAKKVIDDYDLALANLRKRRMGIESKVVVGYLYGAFSSILLKALGELRVKHPSVEVIVKALEIDEIYRALDDDEISVGLTTGLFAYDDSVFRSAPLGKDGLRVYFSSGSDLEARESISIEELKGRADFVSPSADPDKVESAEMNNLLGLSVGQSMRPGASSDFLSVRFLIQSEGVCALGFSHIVNSPASEGLSSIPIVPVVKPINLKAVWKKSNDSEAIRDLISLIAKEAAKVYEEPCLE